METEFRLIAERLRAHAEHADLAELGTMGMPDDVLTVLEEVNLEPLLRAPGETAHADTALVRAIQTGDMAAFESLFFKYQGQIYRTAYAITRDPGAAEEVLQDCFYKTYLNIMNIT